MSSLTPVCRDSMRLLKAQKDEEKRIAEEAARTARVNQIVSEIYKNAIKIAETTTETSYKYQRTAQDRMADAMCGDSPSGAMIRNNNIDTFYTTRMPDILAGLQQLFPGCFVAHKSFIIAQDRTYDLSTLNPDSIPFIKVLQRQEYILVDWS